MEQVMKDDDDRVVMAFEVPLPLRLGEAFDLEKTICSHGLFMMSPNQWDPLSLTFTRPLRLLNDNNTDSQSQSVLVSISHPSHLPHSLLVRVYGNRTPTLSPQHQQSLLHQVVRMLRLSHTDDFNAREFRNMAAEIGVSDSAWIKDFGGRVFRSPTLFEDMVKCILLCNCQWSRTLSMANALCQLQLELHSQSTAQLHHHTGFIPNTPATKEPKRKKKITVSNMSTEELDSEADTRNFAMDPTKVKIKNSSPSCFSDLNADSSHNCKSCDCEVSTKFYQNRGQGKDVCLQKRVICNFPSPKELANLDETFLAKRCGLGYRAGRIIKLARGIVEGRIPLGEFEQISVGGSLSAYENLNDQLREIEGFGAFTRANVLMCMGFYHVIPTDSETVRHLKQVHAKNSTVKTVQRDVEEIYGKYAPFQFLAYWAELWHFYQQRFGKLSGMPCSDYKLITASNMIKKKPYRKKKNKLS